MCFEIPLLDGRVVYMKRPESDLYAVVWVSAEKFLKIWEPRQKNDIIRTCEKYEDIELCFAQSMTYPVHFIDGDIIKLKCGLSEKFFSFLIHNFPLSIRKIIYGILPHYKVFRFDDGITRATWLINNGAQFFPIACSPSQSSELAQLAGVLTS